MSGKEWGRRDGGYMREFDYSKEHEHLIFENSKIQGEGPESLTDILLSGVNAFSHLV